MYIVLSMSYENHKCKRPERKILNFFQAGVSANGPAGRTSQLSVLQNTLELELQKKSLYVVVQH